MPFSAIVSTCLQHFHLENRIFLNSHFSLKFFWRMRFASLTAIKATLRCASMCVRVCVCATCLSLRLSLCLCQVVFPTQAGHLRSEASLKSSAVSMWHTYATLIVLLHIYRCLCVSICVCVSVCEANPCYAGSPIPYALSLSALQTNFRAAVAVRLFSSQFCFI